MADGGTTWDASRLARGAALIALLALATALAFAQPWDSPWWTYADADGTYAASSLNMLHGNGTRYLDHPGLPVQEALEIGFAGDWIAHGTGKDAFVDRQLLNLDRARPLYRGYAIGVFLLGAALAFLLLARTFGHWGWGLAGGALWLAGPELVTNSIQVRPDVALAATLVVFAYFLGRAVTRRAPADFFLAGIALGFATMVKLHAAGAVVALILGALARPPLARERPSLVPSRGRERAVTAVLAVLALVLALAMNIERRSFHVTGKGALYGAITLAAGAGGWYAARSRRVASLGLAVAGIVAGLWIPIVLDLPDGLRALVSIATELTGGGVNDVPLFASPVHLLDDPLQRPLVLFVVAGVAAVVGVFERDLRPGVWFAGAAALGVMAQARVAEARYFAAPYVLALFAVVWLFQRRRASGALAAVVLGLYVVLPVWQHRHIASNNAGQDAALAAPATAFLDAHLKPDEVAIVPQYWPFAGVRFWELVQVYVDYVPRYPYRTIEDSVLAVRWITDHGARLRYFAGPQASTLTGEAPLHIGAGDFVARPVPGVPLVAQLVSGGGVDRLYSHPDAPYDPWTGYFKDPQGRYWAADGTKVPKPARRRYLPKEHLWVDAYGDLWTAKGAHAGHRDDLRTAP